VLAAAGVVVPNWAIAVVEFVQETLVVPFHQLVLRVFQVPEPF
jgi:hypothetical protein